MRCRLSIFITSTSKRPTLPKRSARCCRCIGLEQINLIASNFGWLCWQLQLGCNGWPHKTTGVQWVPRLMIIYRCWLIVTPKHWVDLLLIVSGRLSVSCYCEENFCCTVLWRPYKALQANWMQLDMQQNATLIGRRWCMDGVGVGFSQWQRKRGRTLAPLN